MFLVEVIRPALHRVRQSISDAPALTDLEGIFLTFRGDTSRADEFLAWAKEHQGIIRRDLRNRPLVVVPGGVLVVETPSRASAGAHYTPRPLAEEVVRYALEPLVFDPGPHQTVDGWVPVSSDRILDLKVADIGCGSGAFLVAAARYLAARLVEAWHREGVGPGDGTVEPVRPGRGRRARPGDSATPAISGSG